MTGWFRLHRGWRDCEAFDTGAAFTEHEAWLWLLEHAAFKPVVRRNAKGERIPIARGQLHTSLRSLGEAWGWGKNKVARYLERLTDHDMIGTAAGQSGVVISITNYEKYQEPQDSRDTKSGTAAGQPRDTQEESKEGKENKPSRSRARRAPDFEVPDWIPAEPWAAYAAMRARKKAPLDDYIAAKQFDKLAALAAAGWDLAKVLDKATVNNWTDIYAPVPGRDDSLRAVSSAKPTGPLDGSDFAELQAGRIDDAEFDRRRAEKLARAQPPPDRQPTGTRAIGQLINNLVQQELIQ